jgi:hypothetical protein
VEKANPAAYVTKKSPPIYISHGTVGPLVPYYESELLFNAYEKAKAKASLTLVPGATHTDSYLASASDSVGRTVTRTSHGKTTTGGEPAPTYGTLLAFLDKNLKSFTLRRSRMRYSVLRSPGRCQLSNVGSAGPCHATVTPQDSCHCDATRPMDGRGRQHTHQHDDLEGCTDTHSYRTQKGSCKAPYGGSISPAAPSRLPRLRKHWGFCLAPLAPRYRRPINPEVPRDDALPQYVGSGRHRRWLNGAGDTHWSDDPSGRRCRHFELKSGTRS